MKNKVIDENLIRISGKFPIEKQLELGSDIVFKARAGVVKQEFSDNQDGTVNQTFVAKLLEIEIEQ